MYPMGPIAIVKLNLFNPKSLMIVYDTGKDSSGNWLNCELFLLMNVIKYLYSITIPLIPNQFTDLSESLRSQPWGFRKK